MNIGVLAFLALAVFLLACPVNSMLSKQAFALAQSGNESAAIILFRQHLQLNSHDSTTWCNYAMALLVKAYKVHNRTRSIGYLSESLLAYNIAWMMSPFNSECTDGFHRVRTHFMTNYPSNYTLLASIPHIQAVEIWRSTDILAAVPIICSSEHVRVTLSVTRAGRVATSSLHHSSAVFHVCGAIHLHQMFPTDIVLDLKKNVEPLVSHYISGISSPSNINTTYSAKRSDRRYEVHLPLKPPFSSPEVVANDEVLQFIRTVLSERVEIDTMSFVTSLPGASAQHWHVDVDSPYRTHFDSSNVHVPPSGLVMIIPTASLPIQNGPTQVALGSHLSSHIRSKFVTFHASVGDISLFDIRLLHRGLANKSGNSRTILYVSYLQEWFHDHVNFRDIQSSHFDSLESPSLRKLLRRVDSRTLVSKLKDRIDELGGSTEDLVSTLYLESTMDVYSEIV